jgi:tartrate dehydrogenase/decarboxylase/D-malate dehydrogenase
MFEPVHGSAPDIFGKKIANPIGQIWSGAMMLRHLGAEEAANAVERAIEETLAEGKVRTPDIGGKDSTEALGIAIADAVKDADSRQRKHVSRETENKKNAKAKRKSR